MYSTLQGDAYTKRFLFMYYGKEFSVKYFQGKFRLSSVEGTTDDRGCNFIYMNTVARIRVSQLSASINEYNMCVPSTGAMRLQGETFQPEIVTMSSKKIEGAIYFKIQQDKETKNQRGKSNYWSWDPESDNDDTIIIMRQNSDGLEAEDESPNPSKGKKRVIPESEDQFKKAKLHPSADNEGCCSSTAGNEKKMEDVLFHMKETEKYKAKTKKLESELAKVNDDAEEYMLNIEQRLHESEEYKTIANQRLQQSEDKLNQCKKDAEEYKASMQESETKLGIFKEEALASEQRIRQELEAKVKRVEKVAEEELVRVKGEAVAACEASEAELTKVNSEAEAYKTTAEQLLQKSKEDCKKLTNEHDTYRAHIENPYIEGSTAYYKMQYDTLKSDMQNPDKYGSAAYHKNETDMCNLDCADLRMKLEKLPELLEDLERLKEKVNFFYDEYYYHLFISSSSNINNNKTCIFPAYMILLLLFQ